MKVVILAGGLGTRISEESRFRPKPLIEIGGMPILWHVMKIFYHQGFNEFIICAGYKSESIKRFFQEYALSRSDIEIDFNKGVTKYLNSKTENWKVTVIDTGLHSMTGGRIGRIKEYLDDETFMMTYGDGVSDVDINTLIRFHKKNNATATLTSVVPPGRFGELIVENDQVKSFQEKPASSSLINGGFFVLEPEIFSLIRSDEEIWEQYPLETLANQDKLFAFKHEGFWHPMDTMKDREYLDSAINNKTAPWISW